MRGARIFVSFKVLFTLTLSLWERGQIGAAV
jgi:hypothetical protein